MVYLVVSASSVLQLIFHPSEGGLNCRWYLRVQGAWKELKLLDLLWARSRAQVPASLLGSASGQLDREMTALAWKLDEVGADLLAGRVDWLTEYEQNIRPAWAVTGTRATELSSVGGGSP